MLSCLLLQCCYHADATAHVLQLLQLLLLYYYSCYSTTTAMRLLLHWPWYCYYYRKRTSQIHDTGHRTANLHAASPSARNAPARPHLGLVLPLRNSWGCHIAAPPPVAASRTTNNPPCIGLKPQPHQAAPRGRCASPSPVHDCHASHMQVHDRYAFPAAAPASPCCPPHELLRCPAARGRLQLRLLRALVRGFLSGLDKKCEKICPVLTGVFFG